MYKTYSERIAEIQLEIERNLEAQCAPGVTLNMYIVNRHNYLLTHLLMTSLDELLTTNKQILEYMKMEWDAKC